MNHSNICLKCGGGEGVKYLSFKSLLLIQGSMEGMSLGGQKVAAEIEAKHDPIFI